MSARIIVRPTGRRRASVPRQRRRLASPTRSRGWSNLSIESALTPAPARRARDRQKQTDQRLVGLAVALICIGLLVGGWLAWFSAGSAGQ